MILIAIVILIVHTPGVTDGQTNVGLRTPLR